MQDGNALFRHIDESLHPVIPHRCNRRSGSLSKNWEKERYIVRKSKITRFLVKYSTRLPCSVMSMSVLTIAHAHSRLYLTPSGWKKMQKLSIPSRFPGCNHRPSADLL